VASAFISYAHEDQEFMLALVEHLQGQGLDIRYDQVVLNIGDSLIQKISREIADGDFLVAVVSPDSVALLTAKLR
jgi:predicted nucleotide-binding protein